MITAYDMYKKKKNEALWNFIIYAKFQRAKELGLQKISGKTLGVAKFKCHWKEARSRIKTMQRVVLLEK